MTEQAETTADPADELDALRAKADRLETELLESGIWTRARLIQAELRLEAFKAGMVDMDGLKLADLGQVSVTKDGDVQGGPELMAQLQASKPWLFAKARSSSVANPPPAVSTKPRLATEMSLDEWRAARAEMLRRR